MIKKNKHTELIPLRTAFNDNSILTHPYPQTNSFIPHPIYFNSTLITLFGLRLEDVTGHWRKLHNEELWDLYFAPALLW
jgi:hypothetical protein